MMISGKAISCMGVYIQTVIGTAGVLGGGAFEALGMGGERRYQGGATFIGESIIVRLMPSAAQFSFAP
jgi:hypothetical protein